MSEEARRSSLGFEETPLNEAASHSVSGEGARQKLPSSVVSESEVRVEKAVDLKRRRAGHLGEVRKRVNRVHELLEQDAKEEDVVTSLNSYETAFHKFVDAHEEYLQFEDDGEGKALAEDSYEKERESKFLLEIEKNKRKSKAKRPSSRVSCHSARSGASVASSKRSVREKRRLLEESRLKIEALEEKQNLERRMEEEEADFKRMELQMEEEKSRRKAEWSRRMERLQVELEMKKATMALVMEEEELDSKSKDHGNKVDELEPPIRPPEDASQRNSSLEAPLEIKNDSVSYGAFLDKRETGDIHEASFSDGSSVHMPLPSPSRAKDTPGNQRTALNAAANEFAPPGSVTSSPTVDPKKRPPLFSPDQRRDSMTPSNRPTGALPSSWPNQTPLEQTLLQIIQHVIQQSAHPAPQHQPPDSHAWSSLADAIKQGPSLPKIELMKFGGDPTEYAEFSANFRDNIESQVKDDSQRLTRLLAQCVGRARDAIKSCVNLPLGQRYGDAWKTLQKNFGQPHMVTEAHMRKLRELNLRKADAANLMEFARKLEDSQRVLMSMGPRYMGRLDNEDTIIMLMKKLPEEGLKRKWTDRAGDLIQSKGQVDFSDFLTFIRKQGERINNRFGQELKSYLSLNEREKRYQRPEQPQFRATTMATQSSIGRKRNDAWSATSKCPQCAGPHRIWQCEAFRGASYEEWLQVVRKKKLCGSCLGEGHFSRSCQKGFSCRIQGCGKKHHSLIHPPDSETRREHYIPRNDFTQGPVDKNQASSSTGTASAPTPTISMLNSRPTVNSSTVTASEESVSVAAVQSSRPRVCFKIVPVKVSGPSSGKELTTYAFLDSGSDATLCRRRLVDELDLESNPTEYTIATVNHEGKESGRQVHLEVEALDGGAKFTLDNVLTTESLPIAPRHFAKQKELKKWPHLSGISLPEIDEKDVTILIGCDRPEIIDNDSERRRGKKGEPFAAKTPLSWTVYGPMGEAGSDKVHINFIRSEHDEMLSKQLEQIYNMEFGDTLDDTEQSLSIEDKRAKQIMDDSVKLVDGHYQLKLPFRSNPPRFPDSLPTAKKRLYWLKKKMEKNPKFHEQYSSVIKKYQQEGASRLVPDAEVHNLEPIWYLPHHAVWHPRKPNEPRVVFDCACKTEGVSFNDQLLQGPENTSSLLGVVLRFRVHSIAVAADVRRMSHQVFVAPEDRGALCYLWWPDGDLKNDPKTYQMLVHIFGATSSPSICGYALRKTAIDNGKDFLPETVDAVQRDFYVDDLLKSFPTTDQAVRTTKQLQELLAKGGFQLTKWISNDREVLSAFPPEDRAPAIKYLDLKCDSLPMDRALGVHWNVQEDTFNMIVSDKVQPENRKGVLSSIASIYDLLGFISPLLLPGREINQELCRLKHDWIEPLPKELAAQWRQWKEGLATLTNCSIPRSYTPQDFGEAERVELHHFADASEGHGYGTVSYLRSINKEGRIHNSFVMGKSRVRPLRSGVSVPKLELTAATLLIKMNGLIKKELQGRIEINSVTFWTDSTIVMRYIFNENKRFVTFVANRIAVIREGSRPAEWRHVRTEVNPADYASRGIKASETEKLAIWMNGPDFLWKESHEWPPQPADLHLELSDHDEGVKREKISVNVGVVEADFWNSLFERYSTWKKLRRAVAWIIHVSRSFLQLRKAGKIQDDSTKTQECKTICLSLSELEEAEKRIMRSIQNQEFTEEFRSPGSKKGPLAKLKPFVKDGLLRVGGRLDRSELEYDAKHPIILPGKHRVTEMVILHYHLGNGHVGVYQVLAETRQRFWIVSGISSVKRVLGRCHGCKRRNAAVGEQITAPLPVVRVSSDGHQLIYPFAAVGVDYFGPLYVRTGPVTRSSKNPKLHKRYGCIFTCLRYRAVHIEIANDLSTDSFINAITRFVGRRGPPRIIYSDNGTNFRGAETDVLKALQIWDKDKIRGELQRKNIEWHFNPPAASHQGGVWERLIRSVRRILNAMIGQNLVNDEILTTFLVEVEKILNNRPITRVSSDPNDLDALTPSHILLLRQNPCSAPGEFQDLDKFQSRWKHVHILANEFWQRWVKEYLPTLQERQKWLDRKPNFKVGI